MTLKKTKRSIRLAVRLTSEERLLVDEASTGLGYLPSQWARNLIVSAAKAVKAAKDAEVIAITPK